MATNKVILTGKINKMPSREQLASAAANNTCVRFNLAVATQWQTSEQLQTEWFACVINGKQAETFLRYTQKGASVKINGHLHMCPFETKEGQSVYGAEVVVDSFQLLELPPESLQETVESIAQPAVSPNRRQEASDTDTLKNQVLEFLKDEHFI